MYAQMPRVYDCEIKGERLSCVPIKRTTHKSLIQYCKTHPDVRFLVRYPIGQHKSKEWKERVERSLEVVMSESFYVTRDELRGLLRQFYSFSSHINKPGFIEDKLEKTWDPKGKITIYVVKLRFGSDDKELRRAKKFIRAGYDTMHVLHTSDNQKETVHFAEHIYGNGFLANR